MALINFPQDCEAHHIATSSGILDLGVMRSNRNALARASWALKSSCLAHTQVEAYMLTLKSLISKLDFVVAIKAYVPVDATPRESGPYSSRNKAVLLEKCDVPGFHSSGAQENLTSILQSTVQDFDL